MITTIAPQSLRKARALTVFSPLAGLPLSDEDQLELSFRWQLASFYQIINHDENQSDLFERGRPAEIYSWQADLKSDTTGKYLIQWINSGNTMVSHPASGLGALLDEFTTGAETCRAGFERTTSILVSIEYNFVNGISKLDRWTEGYGLHLAESFDWYRSYSVPRLDVQGFLDEKENLTEK